MRLLCFGGDASSLCAMGVEILKFQNDPAVTSYKPQGVLRFSNTIFCVQHIVITLPHCKYHIIIKLLAGSFQLAIYVSLITYLVSGIILVLIKNEYVWHFPFSKKLRGTLNRKIGQVDVIMKMFLNPQPFLAVVYSKILLLTKVADNVFNTKQLPQDTSSVHVTFLSIRL